MSTVGKFSRGCLKRQRDRLCYFSSVSHPRHYLPLSCSCQSHLGRASGGLIEPPHTPFPSGSLYTKTHMCKQTPLPNSSSNLPLWSSIRLSRFEAIGEHSLALLRRFLNIYSELLLQTHLNNTHRLVSPAANCLLVTVGEWSRWRHDSHTSCWEGSLNTPRSLVPLRGRTRRVETTVPRALEALFAHWPVSCFLRQTLRSSAFFGKQRLEREAYRPTNNII